MSDSNAGYSDALATEADELAGIWDGFTRLPNAGENDELDAFCAAKHIDLGALYRIGARLAQPHVLAFVGEGYIKFRDVRTGEKWGYVGSTFPKLKLIQQHAAKSDTVIIVEGETDACRVMRLYPDADVASLPAGAKRFTPAYAAQLEGYVRVAVGLDPDQAGEEGAAKIMGMVPHAVRLLPGASDWCELEGPPPPLPPRRDIDHAGPIVFQSLLEVDTTPPVPLVDDLIYDGGHVHMIDGHPGSGKSTMALHIGLMVMEQNRHVVWLDYEMGDKMTKQKLLEVGVPEVYLADRFHYAAWPPDIEDNLHHIAERYPDAIVVVDSISKALAAAGINENDNAEVTGWTTKVVKTCKTYGMPLLLIDHIAKSGDHSPYSRGAGAKHADVDVHWRAEAIKPFNRKTIGVIKLKITKDRGAVFPFESFWQVGDGEGLLPITPTDDPGGDPNDPAQPSI